MKLQDAIVIQATDVEFRLNDEVTQALEVIAGYAKVVDGEIFMRQEAGLGSWSVWMVGVRAKDHEQDITAVAPTLQEAIRWLAGMLS